MSRALVARSSPTRSTARSKEMFSSCTSLLVDGVNTGSGSWSLSCRPAGRAWPCIVPLGLVLLPRRARQVAAHDALDLEHLGLAAQHDPPGEVGVGLGDAGGQVGDVGGHEVAAGDVAEDLEPERRDRGEHAALVEDRLVEHDVERGEAVGGDHQELVVADGVDVPDLAGVQVGKREGHARRTVVALEDRLGAVGRGVRVAGHHARRPGRRRPRPGPRRCRRTTAARRPAPSSAARSSGRRSSAASRSSRSLSAGALLPHRERHGHRVLLDRLVRRPPGRRRRAPRP